MFIKIAVLNNSGNVGKSTICANFLKPRIPESNIIKVETINNDGTTDETLSAKEFLLIQQMIEESDAAIIDIGASNIELFLMQIKKHKGSHEDIDYFIIPTVPDDKQQVDTISTIENLLNLGIEPEKIKILFNRADQENGLKKQFPVIFGSSTLSELSINEDNAAVIYETDVFSLLRTAQATFEDFINDDRDFKDLIRKAETKNERSKLTTERAIKRLVSGANDEFDIAFSKLNIL